MYNEKLIIDVTIRTCSRTNNSWNYDAFKFVKVQPISRPDNADRKHSHLFHVHTITIIQLISKYMLHTKIVLPVLYTST